MILMIRQLATKILRAPDPESTMLVVGGRGLGMVPGNLGRLQLGKPSSGTRLLFTVLVGGVFFLSLYVKKRVQWRKNQVMV